MQSLQVLLIAGKLRLIGEVWGLRDYGEETITIWDAEEGCEHEWDKSDREHDNLRYRGATSIVGNEKNEAIHQGKQESGGQFCQKCGAWRGQLGLEPSLDLYLSHLWQITDELYRVLKPSGVMFWNHGDSYGGSGGSGGDYNEGGLREDQPKVGKSGIGIVPKCMAMQNYRLIQRMVDEQGWILRNTIIWNKPNHMPSSVKDRFTNSYEPIFMLTKNNKPLYYWNEKTGVMADNPPSERIEGRDWEWREVGSDYSISDTKIDEGEAELFASPRARAYRKKELKKYSFWHSLDYWFDLDAVREPFTAPLNRWGGNNVKIPEKTKWNDAREKERWQMSIRDRESRPNPSGKNPGDVWTIPTQPFSGAKSLADYVGADGKFYKRSGDCPIHGHHNDLQIRKKGECDEPQDPQMTRIFDISNYHVREPEGEYDSIRSLCYGLIPIKLPNTYEHTLQNISENKTFEFLLSKDGLQNNPHTVCIVQKHVCSSDYLYPLNTLIAILHNNQNHKNTSLINPHDTLSLKISSHKPDIQQELFCYGQDQHIAVNNILADAFLNVREMCPLVQTPVRNIDIPYINKGGKVYKCTCKEVKVDHFAVFPEELPERAIKCSCPAEICTECGKVRVRITDTNFIHRGDKGHARRGLDEESKGNRKIGIISREKIGWNEYETIGWTICQCNAEFRPGIVLDPFLGSGTTMKVARRLGMSCIGIEINKKYVEMAKKEVKWNEGFIEFEYEEGFLKK